MTLAEIQRAIEKLPEDEQTELATWVAERYPAGWAEQVERDFSSGGAGMELLQHVEDQVQKGESRPFSAGHRVQLPLIKCAHRARPGEEMTPERVAAILFEQEDREDL
jgi:hypothetical protein